MIFVEVEVNLHSLQVDSGWHRLDSVSSGIGTRSPVPVLQTLRRPGGTAGMNRLISERDLAVAPHLPSGKKSQLECTKTERTWYENNRYNP